MLSPIIVWSRMTLALGRNGEGCARRVCGCDNKAKASSSQSSRREEWLFCFFPYRDSLVGSPDHRLPRLSCSRSGVADAEELLELRIGFHPHGQAFLPDAPSPAALRLAGSGRTLQGRSQRCCQAN
eukprot:scaffold47_cov258-Pinguiococcus_pyrenoidosus.AAC.2